ncbi:hypothetical protein F383_35351 [Gossypium arboreum]|uniref:Uncharacterized protein n=1 Tax=Gossypium arboreum TaxID=29729 RepID=A0A0B0NYD5_GOSAR|nr:hypothetical protein F383_21938 [Gossypium arboreum]KHG16864.1 hypothetical protein F383_21623 [Gossypium arboreum]KHG22099.1 hypothetical protein F383_01643 [Gossypium arboreum]KHG28248.1 hypothetical protein F383_35351 [Gossypium arboreum]
MLLSFKIFNFFYSMILALERKHMPLEFGRVTLISKLVE